MQFVKDAESQSFERTVFSFLEVTGNIGGLSEIMEIGGGFLVGIFSGKIFLFSLLSKLYHVEEPDNIQENLMTRSRIKAEVSNDNHREDL
mmetsp:Transcript_12871/g.11404  ORF Transcript_12871/g.11404 Transcript_12871/m.11404 type:complete len:90 (+) Transcript_12871:84-353(+)